MHSLRPPHVRRTILEQVGTPASHSTFRACRYVTAIRMHVVFVCIYRMYILHALCIPYVHRVLAEKMPIVMRSYVARNVHTCAPYSHRRELINHIKVVSGIHGCMVHMLYTCGT